MSEKLSERMLALQHLPVPREWGDSAMLQLREQHRLWAAEVAALESKLAEALAEPTDAEGFEANRQQTVYPPDARLARRIIAARRERIVEGK